jgi:chemotaxis response regulator CheB
MFIVVHTSPEGPGLLAEILDRATQLPVHNPKHGESIKPGHIYVAKPNHHLLVLPGHVELGTGPLENGFRPAADRCSELPPNPMARASWASRCPADWTMERLDSKPSNSTEV